ncbi:MAG: DMT family transporter [Alphaproteobacteria bacterium]|nr:DMT family transporter [Alphaproteobacteria bacterium]
MSAVAARPAAVPSSELVLLVVSGAIWGGGTTISKFLATSGHSGPGVTFWQTAIAATVLLAVALWRRRLPPLNGQAILYYIVVGIIGIGMPNANMVYVTGHIPAANMAVALTTVPVLTYLLSLATGGESFDRLRAAGIALGLAGAAALVLPQGSLPSPELVPYATLAFLTPVLYAVGNVWAERRWPGDADPLSLACGMLYAAAIGTGIHALAEGSFHRPWVDASIHDAVLVGFGLASAFAFVCFFVIVRLAGAVYFSQCAYLVTLFGVAFAALAFGERPGWWLAVAAALVFGGVTLVNLGARRAQARLAAAA